MLRTLITWQDVQRMSDESDRYEAIEGGLFVSAAPSTRHQRVGMRLTDALYLALERPGLGEVFHAPFGVEFPVTEEGVEPDLVFVSRERAGMVSEEGAVGAPDLVVEVLSPSTARYDRVTKRRLYERQGVGEYWIVDPAGDFVDVWRFSDDPQCTRHETTLPVRLGARQVAVIDLTAIFAPGHGSRAARPLLPTGSDDVGPAEDDGGPAEDDADEQRASGRGDGQAASDHDG